MTKEEKQALGLKLFDAINNSDFDEWLEMYEDWLQNGQSKTDGFNSLIFRLYHIFYEPSTLENNRQPVQEVEKWENAPKTLEEAIQMIDASLSQEEKDAIKKKSGSSRDGHFAFYELAGMGMRNTWGLWGESPLALWLRRRGIWMADDMSGVISTAYYLYLHGKKVDEEWLRKEAEFYDAYWTASNCPLESYIDFINNQHKNRRSLNITINGKVCEIKKPFVEYGDVIALSDLPYREYYTVVYHGKKRKDSQRSGSLINKEGDKVVLQEGMSFSVAHTGGA